MREEVPDSDVSEEEITDRIEKYKLKWRIKMKPRVFLAWFTLSVSRSVFLGNAKKMNKWIK